MRGTRHSSHSGTCHNPRPHVTYLHARWRSALGQAHTLRDLPTRAKSSGMKRSLASALMFAWMATLHGPAQLTSCLLVIQTVSVCVSFDLNRGRVFLASHGICIRDRCPLPPGEVLARYSAGQPIAAHLRRLSRLVTRIMFPCPTRHYCIARCGVGQDQRRG